MRCKALIDSLRVQSLAVEGAIAIVTILSLRNGVLSAIVVVLNWRDGVWNSKVAALNSNVVTLNEIVAVLNLIVAVLNSNDGVPILKVAAHDSKL